MKCRVKFTKGLANTSKHPKQIEATYNTHTTPTTHKRGGAQDKESKAEKQIAFF